MHPKMFIGAVTAVFLLAACRPSSSTDELIDHAHIYSATIREVQSFERERDLVYVISTTEDMAIFEGTVAPPQSISSDLQEAIVAELSDEPYRVIWIEAFEDAPIEPDNWRETPGWKIAEGEGIVITLGNIHLQEDGSVQVSFFMTCADMCGIGQNFILKHNNGVWQVTGSIGPVIAS